MINSLKQKIKKRAGVPDIFSSLEHLKAIGFNPAQIIDVGAYQGEFTLKTKEIFPNANFLMVEAMQKKEPFLKKICAKDNKMKYAIAVLGAETGNDVQFSEIETASSVLEEISTPHERVSRKTTALSDIVDSLNIQKVDLIKLDVQGYELEVLKGFDKYLHNTDAILSEVSLLDIHKNVPLIRDYLNFMYEYKFVTFDICSTNLKRPLDGSLYQTDLLFVKEDSTFRKDKRWSA